MREILTASWTESERRIGQTKVDDQTCCQVFDCSLKCFVLFVGPLLLTVMEVTC